MEMTKKEAADILKAWLDKATAGCEGETLGFIEGFFYPQDEEAFRKAIEALYPRTVAAIPIQINNITVGCITADGEFHPYNPEPKPGTNVIGVPKPKIVSAFEYKEGQFHEQESVVAESIRQAAEPRGGAKWIIDEEDTQHRRLFKARKIWNCHCSRCKIDPQYFIGGSEDWWLVRLPNYCPNCGAKMKGEKE